MGDVHRSLPELAADRAIVERATRTVRSADLTDAALLARAR